MSGSPSDIQICNLYERTDFMVVTGVNAGDPVAPAPESFVGDVYLFADGAVARDLIVPRSGDEPEPGGAAGESSPVLGAGFELDSRLTFMGDNGDKVELLMVRQTGDGGSAHILPLAPLVPGVEYTLIETSAEPGSFAYADYACPRLARGTMIRMADGSARPVESLAPGDRVLTRDSGPQPVRWVAGRTVRAHGHLAPVVITKGTLRNTDDLIVSQSHRMLISDWRAEVMLGSHEVLLRARDLINGDTIYLREGGMVEYFHIMLDNHEIIYAEDIPSESLPMNRSALDGLEAESRDKIVELFPEIRSNEQVPAVAGRMSLKSCEAEALLKQVGFR